MSRSPAPVLISSLVSDSFMVFSPAFLTASAAAVLLVLAGRAAAQTPAVSVLPAIGFEPREGSLTLKGTVRLATEAVEPVTVSWITEDGTALAGADYTAAAGELTIAAGSLTAPLEVTLLPDDSVEAAETFSIRLTAVSGTVITAEKAVWTIRDTDRPAVAYVADTVFYENGPSIAAPVDLYPTGFPFSVEFRGHTPVLTGLAGTLNDFGFAEFPVDWTMPAATFSANGAPVSYSLPQSAKEDSLSEMNESGTMLMKLPAGVVAASFGRRLAELAPSTKRSIYPPSTDGNWAAAVRAIDGVWTPPVYKRSPGADGVWRAAGMILPEAIGRADFFDVHMMLRAGRIFLLHHDTYQAWVLRPGDPEGTTWVQEAHIESLPPVSTYSDSMAFDGETFVCNIGAGNLLMINRNGGAWNSRQIIPWSGPSGDRIMVSLEEGRLACHAVQIFVPSGPIRFAQRTGPPEAPWVVETGAYTPEYSSSGLTPIERISLRNDALIVGYSTSGGTGPRFHLLRRTDSGEWRLEQTLTDFVAMDRGVILGREHVYADIGPPHAPWQSVGPSFPLPFGDWLFEFIAGVFISVEEGGPFTMLSIREAGAGVTVIDEDSFEIQASAVAQDMEPANRETSMVIGIGGLLAAPVDIMVPYETAPGGTALPGVDYRPVQGIATIKAGNMKAYVAIPVLPDSLIEGPETIVIHLGTPSYGKTVPSQTVTLKDSVPGVAVPERPVFVPEPVAGSETHTVPFRLLQSSEADLDVRYRITGVSATAADVTLVNGGTVTVPAGSAIIPVPLTVLGDSLDEDTEEVKVSVYALGSTQITEVSAVAAIDDLPSGGNTPDSHPAEQGALLDFDPARNVLSNDTSGLTSVILAREAAHGAVVLKKDGTFSYQPHPNFTGTDRFAYTAGGGAGFILPGTAIWKWLHPLRGVDPGVDTPGFQANWMKPGFDDSSWKTGAGQMGYGVLGGGNGVTLDTNIGTPGGTRRYTAYFRTAFEVPAPQAAGVTVEFSCDDAAILYLNGDEIGRYVKAPAGGFATAPDTYTLLAPVIQDEDEEIKIRRLFFPAAQLQTGSNTFAVSVHNINGSSSDLGLRIHQITAGAVSNPTYVSILVRDAGLPPAVMPDTFDIPGVVHDLRVGPLPPFSLVTAGSVYENDGLRSADGSAPDPVLEAKTGGGPFGPVTFDKNTGHFSLSVPSGFFGPASFTYRVRDRDGWSNGAVVRLNIGAGAGYDSWRHHLFGAGSVDAAGLPGSDGDGDGVANLLEYVFGTNPLAADPGAPLELSWTGEAWMLTITAKAGFGQDTFLGVESSPSLEAASWRTLASINDYYPELTKTAPGVIKTEEQSPAGVWKCRLLLPADAKAGRFFRLRASPEPPAISP